jgi:hypothetical protein
MTQIFYTFLMLVLLGCGSQLADIPVIESSSQQESLLGLGIAVSETNNKIIKQIYPKQNKVIEVSPGNLVDSNVPLNYRLYHITSEGYSSFLTIEDQTLTVDTFIYNHEILEIKSIYVHSSDLGKNGLALEFEDRKTRRDSLKSFIHILEISKSGRMELQGVHESFEGAMELRSSANLLSGEYLGSKADIRVDLLLKDGSNNDKYYCLMDITTPEYCVLRYEFSDKDLSNDHYSFDDAGKLYLEIENAKIIVTNVQYNLCNEKSTLFNIQLIKED